MVNDTTTLNGALSELGETLATNITSKGVSASASDGLTTLANKVLQISGDTPTPSTVLFEDDCSTDKTSQYGNSVIITGGTSTLTFNTDHYIMSGSGGDFNGFVIPNTLGKDNIKVRIKAKLSQSNNAYNQFGLMVCNNTTYNVNQGLRIRGDKKFQRFDFNPSESETTIYTHSTNVTDWFYYELVKEGTTLTINMYDSNLNLLGSNTGACTDFSNPNYVFYHLTVRGTSYTTEIQEVLVETLGGGSDCSQYQTQIADAITYINGSGS